MDYRELNTYIDSFTGAVDICTEKLQECRQDSMNVSILDLGKSYLQIHVEKSCGQKSYGQMVMFKGQRYCLTRLGFGLNVAPLIMQSMLEAVLEQDETIKIAAFAYIDVYVNEDVESAEVMQKHLDWNGLTTKDLEKLQNGACVLGLEILWGVRLTAMAARKLCGKWYCNHDSEHCLLNVW